jgi:hypothetical protein
MAASVRMRGGPTRVAPSSLLFAGLGCLAVIGALFFTLAPAKAGSGVIYTNAPQGYASADLGSALLHLLGENFKITTAGVDSDRDIMQRVAADPRSIGLVQRDLYVQYLRDHATDDTRFEFYGNIPVCLMAVVRRGSQIQTYGDLVRARSTRPTTLDVGPANGQLAATFETLREIDPSLANLQVEHRAGARALSRVVTGETDAALFLVLAPYTNALVTDMIGNDALDLVPFFSEDIVLGAARRQLPYLLRQITLGGPGWFSSGRPYHTTCTSLGAVVNAEADATLSEKVAQALLQDAPPASGRPWYAAAGDLFVVAFTEVERLLTGVGEVITAWFSPATPGEAIAAAPGPAPEFQPVRQDGSGRDSPPHDQNDRQGNTTTSRAPIARAR